MTDDVVAMQAASRAAIPGRRLEDVPLVSVRGFFGLLLLTVLALALVAIVVPSFGGTTPAELSPTIMWANIALQAALFAAIPLLYIATVRPRQRLADALHARLTPRTSRDLLLGAGLGLAILVLMTGVVYALQSAHILQEDRSLLVGELGTLVRAHPEFLIVTPIAAGLFEETFFRGFLQPRIGLIGSNVIFGLVHAGYGTVVQLVGPAIVGLALGVVFARTRSLWTCVAAHATFDVVQLVALYASGDAHPTIVGFF